MTDDHAFTNALGNTVSGANSIVQGWQRFLRRYPEYHIDISRSLSEGNAVALFGHAGGRWRTAQGASQASWGVAAAWLAVVEEGRVRQWSVFCDTGWTQPPQELSSPEKVPDPEGDM